LHSLHYEREYGEHLPQLSENNKELPPMKKMLKLTVRIRHKDSFGGKNIVDLLLSLYKENGISGATVLQGVRGYGARGVSRVDVLGLSVNLPIIIETIDEYPKIESVLSKVKEIVGGNGLITLEEANVF
jgi:PII-like signaling protein